MACANASIRANAIAERHDMIGTDATIAVSISNVSKTYPIPLARLKQIFRRPTTAPVEALRDVSFSIREGEIFGLIGRNGAGKTTLTKIIATLVQPTSGRVTVHGRDSVRDEEAVRAQVGLATAEERSFYWRLTSEQNMIFFARLYGLSDRAARSRTAELFARFDLESAARRRFGELSTGNKQRLAVARALLARPPVLLLDEPTRSLDPIASAGMRRLISSLAKEQPPATVLLTSHNLDEIEALCDRVGVISGGSIRAINTPENLRGLHKSVERVRLTLQHLPHEDIRRVLGKSFTDLEIKEIPNGDNGKNVSVLFAREAEDDRLGWAISRLHEAGGRILACDTERATLLDVLESYERTTADAKGES
ncbi:MAG: ABC transporter ATP-binding protein [Pyrinomonadaceae bacterium]|nr:ABC transporter ATP-binding protein [Pyrinomonadaceae bacterium]